MQEVHNPQTNSCKSTINKQTTLLTYSSIQPSHIIISKPYRTNSYTHNHKRNKSTNNKYKRYSVSKQNTINPHPTAANKQLTTKTPARQTEH